MTSTPEPAEPAGGVPDRSLSVPSTLISPVPAAPNPSTSIPTAPIPTGPPPTAPPMTVPPAGASPPPPPTASPPADGEQADHLPTIGLDDVVHQRVRLGVLTLLADGTTIEFAVLRNTLDLTDGNLARHLSVLERAGFVTRRRSDANGGRTRTWMDITPAGRTALDTEISALRRLIAHLDRVGAAHGTDPIADRTGHIHH